MTVPTNQPGRPAQIPKHIQFHIDSVALKLLVRSPPTSPRTYVRVRIADRKDRLKTGVHLGYINLACWKENLAPLALNDASQVIFELRQRQRWKSGSSQIAESDLYPLSKLLEMHGETNARNTYISIPLRSKQSKSGASVDIGCLSVSVRTLTSLEVAKFSLDSAENSVNEFNSRTLSPTHVARYKAGYEALKPICGILDIVGPLVSFSPEPICAAVIGIVRGAAKSVKEQIEQDADVLALMSAIEHIYTMVAATTELQSANSKLEAALRELVLALGDCTKFMLTFCKHSFLRRVARTTDQAKELEALRRRMARTSENLQEALLLKASFDCEASHRMADRYVAEERIAQLARVLVDTSMRPRGTASEYAPTIALMHAWATAPFNDGKNILWLRGPASPAKTAVVTALFDELRESRHLGGYFFFEQGMRRNPWCMVQTLAGQLAERHEALMYAVAQRIEAGNGILDATMEVQLEELLLRPLLAHPPAQPVVLLVDGLEWCGVRKEDRTPTGESERDMMETVLRVLIEGSARFPENVRLVISGQEDERALELLKDCERVVEVDMPHAEVPPPVHWSLQDF
ncbi:hypothetical protein DFH06DRAFT_479832 [Mycena polygramma]|nr:hypothetical protein DFH06DRAFT_479832 [Mycena polygramma]